MTEQTEGEHGNVAGRTGATLDVEKMGTRRGTQRGQKIKKEGRER